MIPDDDLAAAILESMTDAVIIYDPDGRITHENRVVRTMFGLDADPGHSRMSLAERSARLQVANADGTLLSLEMLPATRVIHGEILTGSNAVDLRFVALDGRIVEANVTGAPLRDADGRIVGGVVVYRDVTEPRRLTRAITAERDRLQQVLDVLPVAVVIAGMDRRFAMANSHAREMFGQDIMGQPLPSAESDAYERYGARYPDGTPYPTSEMPLDRSLRGETAYNVQVQMRHATTGKDLQLLFNSMPLHDDAGTQVGAISVLQDISALKEAERARDEFLSSISHDLKTPLTSIRGAAQLARRRLGRLHNVDTTPVSNQLGRIEFSTARMLGLVNDLLDMMLGEMGTVLQLDRAPIDLIALIQRLAEAQREITGRQIIVEASGTLVAAVDIGRIERVLNNLLSNAIKYSPPETDITVHASFETDATGEWAVVTVQDHGLGIPTADLPHIFERFHRGSNVVGVVGGTGVGLASAYHIVAEHGGSLTALSEGEDKGATFTMRLPLSNPS